jgi:hypothetical protein
MFRDILLRGRRCISSSPLVAPRLSQIVRSAPVKLRQWFDALVTVLGSRNDALFAVFTQFSSRGSKDKAEFSTEQPCDRRTNIGPPPEVVAPMRIISKHERQIRGDGLAASVHCYFLQSATETIAGSLLF